MESSFRNLRFLNIIISFDDNIKKLFPIDKMNVISNENKILDSIINDFLNQNQISLNKEYFLYLKRNNKIMRKLNKLKRVYDLKIMQDDEILVSYEEFKIFPSLNDVNQKNEIEGYNQEIQEASNVILVDQKLKNRLKSKNDAKDGKLNTFKNKILIIIISSILGILLIIGIIIFLIYRFKRNKINRNILEYKKEELIIKKSYPLNMLLRFDSVKETEIQIEAENNSMQYINETYDFIFIVRQRTIEKEEKNHIEKELYTGYIGLLNHTMINETDNMITVYDKKLNEYLNNKIDEKSQNLKYVGDDGNFCFAKIEFYLNGEIKNIYLPKEFSEVNFVYIDDISQLIIPKISSNLFSKNISEKIEEILSKQNKIVNRRLSNKRYKKYKKYKIPFNSEDFEGRTNEQIRRMDEMNYTEINYTDDILVEEYLVSPLSESINITLREANEGKNNEDKSNSQLTQYSLNNIENEEVKMEGSLNNISIFSIIDEKGILESVEKKSISTMLNSDNIDEEDDEETKILYNQIYDNNNIISSKDMESSQNEKEFNNNNKINFNLSSILIINTMIINRTDYFQNESLNNKL